MNEVINGDCREVLKRLPECSVQCCVTSPPYYGLRDYGVAEQIGLESTPDEYVAQLVSVFREVRRVLRDDGTLWLNLGDSYASNYSNNCGYSDKSTLAGFTNPNTKGIISNINNNPRRIYHDLKHKDLIGIPWRVAFALQADGWYLRQDIIWHKPNPMPESVTDRCTKSHEYLFLLAKSERYFYDSDAVKEENAGNLPYGDKRNFKMNNNSAQGKHGKGMFSGGTKEDYISKYYINGRNRRSVWSIATQPFSGAHFAVFPPALIEPCILAGSRPNDVVLDPFFGSGTTGQVAQRLGRNWIGIELNPDYLPLIAQRTSQSAFHLQ